MDFKAELKKQLGFLERSCVLYDQGFSDEAIRIATIIRVLVHDTRSSTSLLTHLKATDIKLCSTVGDGKDDETIMAIIGGLVSFVSGDPIRGSYVMPSCYNHGERSQYTIVPLERWINQYVSLTSVPISRRDIYLGAANKDGGAHVDPVFKDEYDLVKNRGDNFVKTIDNGSGEQSQPVEGMHYFMLRQMGEELIRSKELTSLCEPAWLPRLITPCLFPTKT